MRGDNCDARVIAKWREFSKMGIFGDHASQIVPHLHANGIAFGLAFFRKGLEEDSPARATRSGGSREKMLRPIQLPSAEARSRPSMRKSPMNRKKGIASAPKRILSETESRAALTGPPLPAGQRAQLDRRSGPARPMPLCLGVAVGSGEPGLFRW